MSDVQSKPDMPCVIVAGGASRRFGAPKGLAELGGKPLIVHVIERLRAQSTGPIVINAADDGPYAGFEHPVISDGEHGGCGPLAGVHAALCWAETIGAAEVLTVPVDTPFLPLHLLDRLAEVGAPAVAASGGRIHGICGLWPVSAHADLLDQLTSDDLSVMSWIASCGAEKVTFSTDPFDPFFNINTPTDMADVSQYMI